MVVVLNLGYTLNSPDESFLQEYFPKDIVYMSCCATFATINFQPQKETDAH